MAMKMTTLPIVLFKRRSSCGEAQMKFAKIFPGANYGFILELLWKRQG
jgi:hypothetical protein